MSLEFPYAPPAHLAYLTQYADFGDDEVTVEKAGVCPNCGSDQIEYAGSDNEHDPHKGDIVLCHNCSQWCHEDDLDAQDPDKDDDDDNLDEEPDEDENWEDRDNDIYGTEPSIPPEDRIKNSAYEDYNNSRPNLICEYCGTEFTGWMSKNNLAAEGKCPKCGADNYHTNDHYDNRAGSKIAAAEPFSFQAAVASPGKNYPRPISRGVAIRFDQSKQKEIEAYLDRMIIKPIDPNQDAREFNRLMNEGLGTDRPVYDGFINRGGGVEKTASEYAGFFIVSSVTETHDVWAFNRSDCLGVITEKGGFNSHAAVVCRDPKFGLPCVIDLAAAGIEQGDSVELEISGGSSGRDSYVGIVKVNGGSRITIDQNKKIRTEERIFIWVKGYTDTELLGADAEAARNFLNENFGSDRQTHAGLIKEGIDQGQLPFDDPTEALFNAFQGVVFDDGTYEFLGVPMFPEATPEETAEAEAYAQSLASANEPVVQGVLGKTAEELDKTRIKCPKCDSHSYKTLQIKENDKSDFECLTCGTEFKRKVLVVGSTRIAKLEKGQRIEMVRPERKGQKGSILKDNGTDENFDDDLYDILLDNGEELTKVPDSAFKKIKSAAILSEASDEDHYSDMAAMERSYDGANYDSEKQYEYDDIQFEKGQTVPLSHNRGDAIVLDPWVVINGERWVKIRPLDPRYEDMIVDIHPTALVSDEDLADRRQRIDSSDDMYNGQPILPSNTGSLADTPVAEGIDVNQKWFESGYEGHPVMCYMCGNTRTAALGTQCEHCGYILSVRRDGPVATKKWAKTAAGEPLEAGQWYTMHSTDYDVPDVIKVLEVKEEEITASIEGDDKGMFSLSITEEEANKNSYTFEPYELPSPEAAAWQTVYGDPEKDYEAPLSYEDSVQEMGAYVKALQSGDQALIAEIERKLDQGGLGWIVDKYNPGNSRPTLPKPSPTNFQPPEPSNPLPPSGYTNFGKKTARQSFSVTEQQEFINENPNGRARNYDKLSLDGTHYDLDELESEPLLGQDTLSKAFLW